MAGKGAGGPRPFMGSDGNSNSTGSSERKLAMDFQGSQMKLDGSWTFQAQFNALAACNAVVDLSFKEGSIKDVSDVARMKGAKFIHEVLDDIVANQRPNFKRRRFSKRTLGTELVSVVNSENNKHWLSAEDVEKDVKFLLAELQRHRREPAGNVRDAMIADVLTQLEHLPVTLVCLQKTRLAIELNDPFWKGNTVSAVVREKSSALIRRWRAMLKAQVPGSIEESTATYARRSRNLSMDLEECAYGISQSAKKLGGYADLLEAAADKLRQNPRVVEALFTGNAEAKDFVADIAKSVRSKIESRKEVFVPALL
mmetsp:Transcript_7979/g.17784  ORF Transcript_7979/g.17784 Transcript_7979/m.17784 type:complete len:312 (-) Transcript_7979:56-991(-)